MTPRPEIPVLFIAGTGRSGSTILDRVIGMNDGFHSVGEMRNIWKLSFGSNHLCGCGVPFLECDFWNDVCESAFGAAPAEIDVEALLEMQRAVDRMQYAPLLASRRRPGRFQAALNSYGSIVTRLYSSILDVSGDRVIIDSTKDPTHGMVLASLPNFKVHFVHLIRDPRAVAFSWKRVKQHPGVHWKRQNMVQQTARHSARRWLGHNLLAEFLDRCDGSYCRLRYEDFLDSPEESLARILAPYSLVGGAPTVSASDKVLLAPTHTVSGNPVRFEHGALKLKVDDEWRSAMPVRDRRTVTAMTLPLLTKYGYPANPDK